MKNLKTIIALIAVTAICFSTGCIEEELTKPNQEVAGGSPAESEPETPGEIDNELPGNGDAGESSPDESEGGEADDDAPSSSVCRTLDGEVAHECDDGLRCVEFCANDCEGEVCPQICRIDYRCEEAPEGPGAVVNPIGDGAEPEEDGFDNADPSEPGELELEGDDGGAFGVSDEGDIVEDEPHDGDHINHCLSPEGDVVLECGVGFRCVEQCTSPCEDVDGEEVCAAICQIEYHCESLNVWTN